MQRAIIVLTAFIVSSCLHFHAKNDSVTPLNQITFNQVKLEDSFWKPRLDILAKTLVPYALDKTYPAVENLMKTARYLQGDTTDLPFPNRSIASHLYKVMEGAAYVLMHHPDPELEKRLDDIIDIIAQAQQEDGYLYEAHITGVSRNHQHWGGSGMGDKPYSFVFHSHELYNMGHMYEAAIAYYLATGKDKWLQISEKSAQHINKVFFEGDPNYNDGKPVNQAPGHQEIEMALVKLYQITGNRLYLDMAYKFLDIRGKTYIPDGTGLLSATYAQQHLPVAEQRTAVGHAVRAMYLYAGMADVSSLLNVEEYRVALDSIWHNLVDKKMHITGGLGAMHGIEGFGPDYVLPNKDTYNETCSAIGNVMFNVRMFLLTRDARYMDVAEVALFNNVLAGVNFEGNRFFYVNPLESDGTTAFNHGHAGRAPWFGTACCPTSLARHIPQVSGMMYSHDANDIYVTLYASNSTSVPMPGGKVDIQQISDYPHNGSITLWINPEKSQKFNLRLRIPTWAQGQQFVPGDLYHFYNKSGTKEWEVQVNGKKSRAKLENGFAVISRKWEIGDQVELILHMPVKFNNSHELVEDNLGKTAVTRGPLVYCVEDMDQENTIGNLYQETLTSLPGTKIHTASISIFKDIPVIEMPFKDNTNGSVRETKISMTPYYAWNNRGNNPMYVWIPIKMSE